MNHNNTGQEAPEETQQAAQSATPSLIVAASADEIRAKIVEQFSLFQPHLSAYHEYAGRLSALAVEYHHCRLSEVLAVPIEEEVLLTTLDARETPKNLDTKLAQLAQIPGTKIKRIFFDRVKATYYLFI